ARGAGAGGSRSVGLRADRLHVAGPSLDGHRQPVRPHARAPAPALHFVPARPPAALRRPGRPRGAALRGAGGTVRAPASAALADDDQLRVPLPLGDVRMAEHPRRWAPVEWSPLRGRIPYGTFLLPLDEPTRRVSFMMMYDALRVSALP